MPNILVAEDEVIIRMMLISDIEAAGHHTFEAGDEAGAKSILLKQHIECIVTDGDYGKGGSGAALIAFARARDPRMPIIVVTGKEKTMKEALANIGGPAIPILSKPVAFGALEAAIQSVLPPGRGAPVFPTKAAAAPEFR